MPSHELSTDVTRTREILSTRGHRLEGEEDTDRRNLYEVWLGP